MLHFPERQQIALEHLIDGFEIEVRAHVHDREIFLVEVADRVRFLDVAGDAMVEEVDEGSRVPLGVHAHERAKLKKSRIDAPPAPLELRRHGADHVGAEPFDRLFLGELVDFGRRHPRVDRTGQQCQARRLDPVALARHDRCRRKRRDRRLAHRNDMAILSNEAHEVDEVLGIVLQREGAILKLDVARIDPVGDVHLMIAQQSAGRATQKRGEVARHGRDQKDLAIVLAALLAEAKQLAERRPHDPALFDRNGRAIDFNAVDGIVGARMREAGERNQFVIGAHPRPWRSGRMRRPGAQDCVGVLSQQTHAIADIGHPLVCVVHH